MKLVCLFFIIQSIIISWNHNGIVKASLPVSPLFNLKNSLLAKNYYKKIKPIMYDGYIVDLNINMFKSTVYFINFYYRVFFISDNFKLK